MMTPHLLNIVVHIVAGAIAIGIGFFLLIMPKGTLLHRKVGRLFGYFALAVCASAIVGNIYFRFIPVFAVLTVLVLYQLLSGWHVIYTKEGGPNAIDGVLTAGAFACTVLMVPFLLSAESGQSSSPSIVYSSLGTLVLLIAYDTFRWFFPPSWHANLWRFEHIYKLVASLFAMLSAVTGNVIRFGQPYSQLLPSLLGIVTILWFLWRNHLKLKGESAHPRPNPVPHSRFPG